MCNMQKCRFLNAIKRKYIDFFKQNCKNTYISLCQKAKIDRFLYAEKPKHIDFLMQKCENTFISACKNAKMQRFLYT